jgi:hypothetical protein
MLLGSIVPGVDVVRINRSTASLDELAAQVQAVR